MLCLQGQFHYRQRDGKSRLPKYGTEPHLVLLIFLFKKYYKHPIYVTKSSITWNCLYKYVGGWGKVKDAATECKVRLAGSLPKLSALNTRVGKGACVWWSPQAV